VKCILPMRALALWMWENGVAMTPRCQMDISAPRTGTICCSLITFNRLGNVILWRCQSKPGVAWRGGGQCKFVRYTQCKPLLYLYFSRSSRVPAGPHPSGAVKDMMAVPPARLGPCCGAAAGGWVSVMSNARPGMLSRRLGK
jgi:hypothetical protein